MNALLRSPAWANLRKQAANPMRGMQNPFMQQFGQQRMTMAPPSYWNPQMGGMGAAPVQPDNFGAFPQFQQQGLQTSLQPMSSQGGMNPFGSQPRTPQLNPTFGGQYGRTAFQRSAYR